MTPFYYVFEEYLVQHVPIWGPFLERPDDFSGPKANFVIKTCLIVSSTVPSSQIGQFRFITLLSNRYFHCIDFKINDTLILNAKTANVKQLFGPEKFSGLDF